MKPLSTTCICFFTLIFLASPWVIATSPDPLKNTLVTGIVIFSDEDLVPNEMNVSIYRGKEEIAQVRTRRGMFTVDLNGLVAPEERIRVVVWKEKATERDAAEAKCITTTLAEAQNLEFRIPNYYVLDRHKPYPPRGRYVYINNI